jgi:hypothetical protein
MKCFVAAKAEDEYFGCFMRGMSEKTMTRVTFHIGFHFIDWQQV